MLSALLNSFGIVPDLLRGKDPKQALTDNLRMGAMVGGAAAMPGLLGGAGAASGAAGPIDAYLLSGASEGSTIGNSITGAGGQAGAVGSQWLPSAASGLFGNLKQFGGQAAGYIKPVGEAAQAAGAVQGLVQGNQRPMPQPMPMGRQGADPIGQMLQGQMQLEQQRRGSWQGGMNGGLFEELRRKYGM